VGVSHIPVPCDLCFEPEETAENRARTERGGVGSLGITIWGRRKSLTLSI